MSSVILTNWTVYYADDAGAGAGMKQIKWTGTTGTNTLNELYSTLADLFSIPDQNNADDTVPIRAVTPTLYEIGAFDSGDLEPWFIDPESIKHLTDGGLNTAKWKRDPLSGDGTGDIGIIKITRSGSTNIVAGDIGATITNTTGSDDGWLLHIDGNDLWIRPDTNTSADDWDTTGGSNDLVCNAHTDTQATAAVSGENVWSNIYTLGSIEDNSTIFISQSNSVISNTEDSGPGRWWGDGHIDALILTTDTGTLTDRGLLTVYARQFSKKYGFFTTDASAGGRIPVPLATSDDLNNTSGYRQSAITETAAFVVDEVATGGTTGAVAIVTAYTSSLLTYYLVGDLTEFDSSETITGSISGNVAAAGAPADVSGGPATALSIVFGYDNTTLDVNADSTFEEYSIIINCAGVALDTVNERLKYKTRRGETTPGLNLDGINGEQYIGIDYRVDYTTRSATPIPDGSTVTQTLADGTTATSEVVAHDSTNDYVMLRDTRGTLEISSGSAVLTDSSNTITMDGATVEIIAPIQEHPFGAFAGGRFFGARGVGLDNVPAGDSQNYELLDNGGNRIVEPPSVAVSVHVEDTSGNNLEDVQVFIRKDSSNYDYTSHNTNNVAGDATFDVIETVDTDLPQSGWLHVWDASTNTKQNYRYASWTGLVFTLKTEVTGSATSAGDSTTLNSTGIGALDIEEGDTIRNTTDTPDAWAVVDEITANQAITTPLQDGGANTWANTDAFSVHRLAVIYVNTDLIDIPLLNAQTNAAGDTSLTYVGDPTSITVRIRSNEGGTKYVPFNTSGSIVADTGYSLTAILTEDTVAT